MSICCSTVKHWHELHAPQLIREDSATRVRQVFGASLRDRGDLKVKAHLYQPLDRPQARERGQEHSPGVSSGAHGRPNNASGVVPQWPLCHCRLVFGSFTIFVSITNLTKISTYLRDMGKINWLKAWKIPLNVPQKSALMFSSPVKKYLEQTFFIVA